MSNEIAVAQYMVREPFGAVLEAILEALEGSGLRLAARMDMSARIERALGITLPPCSVLFVLPRNVRQVTSGIDASAATFFPMHVVISACAGYTSVQVQGRVNDNSRTVPPDVLGPVIETQRQIVEAIETVATRASILV